MKLSLDSVGMFEAFYNSLKPVDIILTNFEVVKAGKIFLYGWSFFAISNCFQVKSPRALPNFLSKSSLNQQVWLLFEKNILFTFNIGDQKRLFETYHGVFVNVQYNITCDLFRTFLAKNIQKKIEFIVEVSTKETPKVSRVDFTITPQVQNFLCLRLRKFLFVLSLWEMFGKDL